MPSGDRIRATWITNQLHDLYYYTNKRTALGVSKSGYRGKDDKGTISVSTIARIRDPVNMWAASRELVSGLEYVLDDAMKISLGATLAILPLRVLDYCSVSGAPMDDEHHTPVEDAVKNALRSSPRSPHVKLPDGIDGVLVALGDDDDPGIFLVVVDKDLKDSEKKKTLAHELRDLAARIEDASAPSEDDEDFAEI